MGKSYRKTIRFNPEYDESIIKIMEQYKDRNLSQILRKIIRDALLSDNQTNNASDMEKVDINIKEEIQTKQEKVIKWRGF